VYYKKARDRQPKLTKGEFYEAGKQVIDSGVLPAWLTKFGANEVGPNRSASGGGGGGAGAAAVAVTAEVKVEAAGADAGAGSGAVTGAGAGAGERGGPDREASGHKTSFCAFDSIRASPTQAGYRNK
jgi:hypothetical protein